MGGRSERILTMTDPKKISILDYTYALPDERIALHPLPERDASKLLIFKNGHLSEDRYSNIAAHLPANSLLVFNNSRVIRARLRFKKPTGGNIEIFCLEPLEAISEYSTVMNKTGSVTWKCMVGGAGKWKEGKLEKLLRLNGTEVMLFAELAAQLTDAYAVTFSWQPANIAFAAIIEAAGDIPLPPYIKRDTGIDDLERYQTIYAKEEGSVAAPTAGLHFSETVFEALQHKNITHDFVTLHVGAGTFKPVKAASMEGHEMHAEWIDVSSSFILNLIGKLQHPVIATGTTSLRTLESLYWLGVKALLDPLEKELTIKQWEIYEAPLANSNVTPNDALQALLVWMERHQMERLFTQTQLLITPGYRFNIVNALVTNFHQPQSTLLLLVAAVTGTAWRNIYQYALDHDFRFLSYGDGSLLFMKDNQFGDLEI